MNPHALLPLLLATTSLAAQHLPVPDGHGRILQVFDLAAVQALTNGPAAEAEAGVAATSAPPEDSQYLADFVRHFVEPALGPGDDLKVLGGRWLTLLGSPPQAASIDRLMATAAAKRNVLVTATVRIARMTQQPFEQRLSPLLTAKAGVDGAFESVIPAAKAGELLAAVADAELLESPRLTVYPLQRATVSVRSDIPYVQDFTLTRKRDAFLADPVIGIVWDGVVTDLCAVLLSDGTIGLHCDLQSQQVQKPIPQFVTSLGVGAPVTIELPRTTGVHFEQTARLVAGDLVVLAAQKVDGDYLVAIVEAQVDRR